MPKLICVTGAKGGIGKTTSALNLAIALKDLGKDVLLVDANISTPNIGLHLGIPSVPSSLHHVLKGKKEPKEALYTHSSGIKVMPGSIAVEDIGVDTDRLAAVLKELKKHADVIIIDSAAGFGEDSLAALKAADEVLIVTNPEIPAVTEALKTVKLAEKLNKKIVGVLLTRTGKGKSMNTEEVEEMIELPVIGEVPEDKAVKSALYEKKPVIHHAPFSKAGKGYKKVAEKIAEERYESLLDEEALIHKVLRKLGLR